MSTMFVASADGTRIAYDRFGSGPVVVLVSGMFGYRPATRPLAEHLASRFTVLSYDRRGRGESGDNPPYARDREIEDLAALIEAEGGSAMVYGHSSGAGLALNAAAARLPITRLAVHEPPYGPDDENSKRAARQIAADVASAIAEDRRADAIEMFLPYTGLSPETAKELSQDPAMQAAATTMPYDFENMGYPDRGATMPKPLIRSIDIPTLVIAGDASPGFLAETAVRLQELLPDGHLTLLEGADHGAPPDVIGPVVADFFTR